MQQEPSSCFLASNSASYRPDLELTTMNETTCNWILTNAEEHFKGHLFNLGLIFI